MASDRPRLVYLTHSVSKNRGGMELIGRDLMEHLSEAFDITIVSGDPTASLPRGVRGIRVPLPARPAVARIWLYRWLAPLMSRRARREAEVVYSNGAVGRVDCDVTTIHLCHAMAVTEAHSATRAARWARRAALALERRQLAAGAGQLVAVSRTVSDQVRSHYQRECLVINNGIDVEHATARRDRGEGPLRNIIVSHDFVAKGVTIAIDVVALDANVTLTVVGAGDIEATTAYAESRGVADRVAFLGSASSSDIPYGQHDVVLSLSGYESFGLTMVEGAAHGCVVVATDTGVAPDFAAAGGGIIVSRDSVDIARAWSRLADALTWESMSSASQSVAATFDRREMRRAYQALFERAVAS